MANQENDFAELDHPGVVEEPELTVEQKFEQTCEQKSAAHAGFQPVDKVSKDCPEVEGISEGSLRYAAMSLLARREHSRFELQQKLSKRFNNSVRPGTSISDSLGSDSSSDSNSSKAASDGLILDPLILKNVLQQLADEALQSDSRFAEAFTAMRVRKGQGPIRIGKELEQRRVADDIISRCLDVYADQWPALAKKVHAKKYSRSNPAEVSANDRVKQSRFLQYRGFSGEQIQAIWKKE